MRRRSALVVFVCFANLRTLGAQSFEVASVKVFDRRSFSGTTPPSPGRIHYTGAMYGMLTRAYGVATIRLSAPPGCSTYCQDPGTK
jgi:hypothetical protein